MRGAQGHGTLRTVCTPGRHVASAAPGVHPPRTAKEGLSPRLEWVTPWLPASPDQQQVSPEGNTRPSRSPGEGNSHVLLARPGARYET